MLGTLQKGHSRKGRLHTFPPTNPFPRLCLQCWWTSFLSLEATSSTSAQYSYSWVIPAHIRNRRRCQNFFTRQIQMSHDQQEALIPILKTAIVADNNSVIIIATSSLQMHNYHGWGGNSGHVNCAFFIFFPFPEQTFGQCGRNWYSSSNFILL